MRSSRAPSVALTVSRTFPSSSLSSSPVVKTTMPFCRDDSRLRLRRAARPSLVYYVNAHLVPLVVETLLTAAHKQATASMSRSAPQPLPPYSCCERGPRNAGRRIRRSLPVPRRHACTETLSRPALDARCTRLVAPAATAQTGAAAPLSAMFLGFRRFTATDSALLPWTNSVVVD